MRAPMRREAHSVVCEVAGITTYFCKRTAVLSIAFVWLAEQAARTAVLRSLALVIHCGSSAACAILEFENPRLTVQTPNAILAAAM